ncbi:MAG TPA: hypothetical protein VI895_14185 [Bdellovibrionota bacterium]|nr:hypothetical protein [Bdellovibrionota bacterium]
MRSPLVNFFFDSAPWRVLFALVRSSNGRRLREIADLCGLSPRGARLVLDRLQRNGWVSITKDSRSVRYGLELTAADHEFLLLVLTRVEGEQLARRAQKYGRSARRSLGWIDPTAKQIVSIRKQIHDPARSS